MDEDEQEEQFGIALSPCRGITNGITSNASGTAVLEDHGTEYMRTAFNFAIS